MKLKDLITGMVVKLSDDKFYIVIGNLLVNHDGYHALSNFSCDNFASLTQDLRIKEIYESTTKEKTSTEIEQMLQGNNLKLLEKISESKKLNIFEAIDKLHEGKSIKSCVNSKIYRSLDELENDRTEKFVKEGDWIECND